MILRTSKCQQHLFLSSYYPVTSCYVEETSSSLYFLEQWIMCFGFQICLCLPPLPSSLLPVSLSSHLSVPSLSLSLTLWRRVSNRIRGYSTPFPTNSRNSSLEDMMPTILNSSIFYVTSTCIKLSRGYTFIWMFWIRSSSGPFITYMVWLWFEFAFANYSNTMFLSLPLSWRWFDLWGANQILCCARCWATESLTASHHLSSEGLFQNIWQSCVMLSQSMSGSVPKSALTSHAHLPRLICSFFLLSEWSTEPNSGFEAALLSLLRRRDRKWARV